ncbi:hypothetical protein MMC17_004037 [Xylographa soralifera]|nr:hypothetical protein [Xylographa soralifera]
MFPDMNCIKMNQTEGIRDLAKKLRRQPNEMVETLADGDTFQKEIQEGLVIEDFKMLGYVTQRVKFTNVNYMAKSPSPKAYRNCSFKKLVDRKIDAAIGPSHSFEVERRVMVDIYMEKNEKIPGRTTKKWDTLNVLAQERLYLSKDLVKKVENDIAAGAVLSQRQNGNT